MQLKHIDAAHVCNTMLTALNAACTHALFSHQLLAQVSYVLGHICLPLERARILGAAQWQAVQADTSQHLLFWF